MNHSGHSPGTPARKGRRTNRPTVGANAETRIDALFGFAVPLSVPGVETRLLTPRLTWADADAYDLLLPGQTDEDGSTVHHREGSADRRGRQLNPIRPVRRRPEPDPARVDRVFRRLQLVSAALYSLGHGGNDAQKTMGIIAGVLLATEGAVSTTPTVWLPRPSKELVAKPSHSRTSRP